MAILIFLKANLLKKKTISGKRIFSFLQNSKYDYDINTLEDFNKIKKKLISKYFYFSLTCTSFFSILLERLILKQERQSINLYRVFFNPSGSRMLHDLFL
jgi:hypothetical protein